jgi:alpha-beta hydrolase superfamily lysophospholipase
MSSVSGPQFDPQVTAPDAPEDAAQPAGDAADAAAPDAASASAGPDAQAALSPLAMQLRPTSLATQHASGVAAIRAALADEAKLPLQPGGASILMAHDTPPPRGTLVMLHGLTVAPWQFADMAKKFYDQGYDVYIPRLPGEGLQKGTDASGKPIPDSSQMPTGSNYGAYHDFGDQIFAQAKGLGGPVSVAGLSAGGVVALDMAERHPEIKRAVVFSPFIEPAPRWGELTFDASHTLDKVTFGETSKLLDQAPYSWNDPGGKDQAAYLSDGRASYWHFHVGNIDALDKLGEDVSTRAASLKVPVQFVTSAADDQASPGASHDLFNSIAGGQGRNGWYEFPKSEGVPHAMVSPRQYNNPEKLSQITDIAARFLNFGQTSNLDG